MNKEKAVIVDMDGTLAIRTDRTPYEWDKVLSDKPNNSIVYLVNLLWVDGYKIIIVTGRDGEFESLTTHWLDYHSISFDECYSRPAGSKEKDSVVKEQIYLENIKPYYDVQYVLDDRNSVVKKWRELGLTCLQVAEGNF